MERKGFTLVELLVVIAIIALLMGILMPALARVRQIAYRLYCGTNLSGLGKAMLIYAQDYDDEMPRAGLTTSVWGKPISAFANPLRTKAFASDEATITSCFYLLVKFAEVTPKSFICKGDSGVTELSTTAAGVPGLELLDLWDFGPSGQEQKHCSYSYHIPFGLFALTTSSEPGMAIAGDPNPWQRTGYGNPKEEDWADFDPDGEREFVKMGNSITHQDDGQNVLFMDGHTSFEKNAACGIDDDNVYTKWDPGLPPEKIKKKGSKVGPGTLPSKRTDSLLLTDGEPTDHGGR